MDVILDSNIFLRDRSLAGTQFAEFFAHLRRTGSRLVLPTLVLDEVLERHRDEFSSQAEKASVAWKDVCKKSMLNLPDLPELDVEREVDALRERMKNPANGVQVVVLDDMSGVRAEEIARRGIRRIRPANKKGEELRDVILWLLVIDHATRTKNAVAFVSNDITAFADDQHSLHPDLQSDVRDSGAEVAYYGDLGEFIARNSLAQSPLTEDWLNKYLPRGKILEESRKQLEKAGGSYGTVKDCTIESVDFEKGSRYEVSENAFYVEAEYQGHGSLTAKQDVLRIITGQAGSVPGLGEYIAQQLGEVKEAVQIRTLFQYPIESSPFLLAKEDRQHRFRFRFMLSMRVENDELADWQVDSFAAEVVPGDPRSTAHR